MEASSCLSLHSVQFSSVAQLYLTLCNPMNRSTPGLPVHHQLLEFTQTHVHWVSDAIQPSHPLSSPSPPAPSPFQHQGLFQWVNSLHQVAKVLEFQLQHQSFQWTPRTGVILICWRIKSNLALSCFIFFLVDYLFIYLWLCWVCGLCCFEGFPLVAASGGASLWCAGFRLPWLLFLQSTGRLSSCVHRRSRSLARGIFPDRDQTCVPCIGRQILIHSSTREVLLFYFKHSDFHHYNVGCINAFMTELEPTFPALSLSGAYWIFSVVEFLTTSWIDLAFITSRALTQDRQENGKVILY